MSMIMGSLARMVFHEQGLGISRGHDQARAFIEQCLERFEMPAPVRPGVDERTSMGSEGRERVV
jgi:hypothetical protein